MSLEGLGNRVPLSGRQVRPRGACKAALRRSGAHCSRGGLARHPHAGLTSPVCRQHTLSRGQAVALPHLCNMLLAFARLNFRPEQEDRFFGLVRPHAPCPVPCRLPPGGQKALGGLATQALWGCLGQNANSQHASQVAQNGCRSRRYSWSASETHRLGRACHLGEGSDPRPCRDPPPRLCSPFVLFDPSRGYKHIPMPWARSEQY